MFVSQNLINTIITSQKLSHQICLVYVLLTFCYCCLRLFQKKFKDSLTGELLQAPRLQTCWSKLDPEQVFPPLADTGFVQVLSRV